MSNDEREKKVLADVPTQLLIGGKWRDSANGEKLAVEDPSTGETLVEIADGTPDDAQAAMDAAADAQAEWAASEPNLRSEILHNAFEALNDQADDLALLMTLEMGKAVAESKAEITYAAEFFRWFAGEALRIDGNYKVAGNAASRVLIMRQPVGPCYFITPWNFPMAMGTRKIGPAIAAGCTMVAKPAQITPLSMLKLAEILGEAGLPDGVLNIVTSSTSSDVSKPVIGDYAAAKALVHRLDRGRAQADRPGRGQRPQRLNGARRERPVRGLRGRRPRRGGRGRDDRQDAQHRRGVHLGQPLPRARVGRRRVRGEARREDGCAEAGPGHRGRCRRRTPRRRRPARQGFRAGG